MNSFITLSTHADTYELSEIPRKTQFNIHKKFALFWNNWKKNTLFQKKKNTKTYEGFHIFCYFLQIKYTFASKLFQSSIFFIRSRIYSYYLSILNENSWNFISLSFFIDFIWNIIELEVPEINMLVYSLDFYLSYILFVQKKYRKRNLLTLMKNILIFPMQNVQMRA